MQMRRLQQMRGVDITRQFQRMYGPQEAFRGVQKEALDAIVAGISQVLVVMRTGGGKRILFTLPAAGSPDGVTIVIVPVISLRQDSKERCEAQGIRCQE